MGLGLSARGRLAGKMVIGFLSRLGQCQRVAVEDQKIY
jgi:hypothetical protein